MNRETSNHPKKSSLARPLCMEEMDLGQGKRILSAVVTHTVLLACTSLLSLTGNALVCVAFYRNRSLRTITNFYVLSLALADLMMAVMSAFGAVASGLDRWPFGFTFCQFHGFVSVYWGQVSTYTLVLTSINRYFCVVKPQKYPLYFTRKRTFFSIIAVWTSSLVVTVSFHIAPLVYEWTSGILYCRATSNDERFLGIFYVFFCSIFTVTMIIVILGYFSVYRHVSRHNIAIVPSLRREANRQQGTPINAQEIKISKVLFAAVFGYCICWVPFIVTLILEFGFQVSIPFYVQSLYTFSVSISSWINPVIYGFMNRAMRKEFGKLIFCRKGSE